MSLLPFEISQQIANYLDFPSAVRLMRVCKALNTAGEIGVYSEIDLTGSRRGAIPDNLDNLTIESYRRRTVSAYDRVNRTLSGLEKQPHRVEYVKAVWIEPSGGGPSDVRAESLIRILRLLAPRLKRLDVLPVPISADPPSSEFGSSGFFRMLNAAQIDFPKLEWLRYAHSPGEQAVDKWMRRMPRLRELEYAASGSMYSFQAKLLILPDLTPIFPRLRRMTVDNLEPKAKLSVLALLLPHVPNLEFLRIRGTWYPRTKDEALQALGSLAHLKTLVINDGIVEDESDDESDNGTAKGIHFQRLGKLKLGLEEAAVQLFWEEVDELIFEDALFPVAPKLCRMTILTTPRAPLAEYASFPIGPTPMSTKHIDAKLLDYLRRTPLLNYILLLYLRSSFPMIHKTTFVEPELFVSPDRWESEGHRGCILREYHSPTGMKEKRILWHFRTLSRSVSVGMKVHYVGMLRRWEDATRYRDRRVPRDVLKAVYMQAEEDMVFLQGGRGLPLGEGEEAWKILDDWRESAGDESEEEDDFQMDGTEDDDLESDED